MLLTSGLLLDLRSWEGVEALFSVSIVDEKDVVTEHRLWEVAYAPISWEITRLFMLERGDERPEWKQARALSEDQELAYYTNREEALEWVSMPLEVRQSRVQSARDLMEREREAVENAAKEESS